MDADPLEHSPLRRRALPPEHQMRNAMLIVVGLAACFALCLLTLAQITYAAAA
jgi:hypothetical protein